ncbi:dihydroxyacetone kinase subunit DhaL [Methylococcus capsulatus]|uniref:dihydroxyacetone kinase subunit DhaL n=1 Tax=Methylococcus capsulatus TaxID=414 RepID=UPI001C531B21|nr:dihydroxyacetone kinase subunit DhaL [Methylococcus capsulatus]QXP86458.1 dihydroxyacetone kinase subunit L [Methylococcus capsulatus]QXP89325.1 dihydroxyacetone kinase subunit L [Methylococcus capsulatus]QXP93874.1 dihydroxyacetone kinase subunit L [Methylococcus capsulatus]UQN11403.1 dihydroxyacetone kinase subunit DhaL [Methylococcus capsulatus]
MPATPHLIPSVIQGAASAIQSHAEEVSALDQAIGDGDHVVNLQRGLEALSQQAESLAALDWPAALQKIGMTLMASVGGASGSLYGTLFIAMGKAMKDREMNLANLAEAFGRGVEAMKARGKADRGEKTMLDVLIPVADVLKSAAEHAIAPGQLAEEVSRAAEAGMESTRDMLATKGRASFLGERAIGHVDAGARSSQLMISAIAEVLAESAW